MRSRLRWFSALLVGIGVVVTSASAGTKQARSAPPPVERVARELRSGAKSLIVFVSAAGKEYVATAGSRRPGADQRFRVGSVTKTFTATIVLQLVQEGTLRLDSTLEDHVPGVIPRGEEITIRHLLQHRSGLANVTEYPQWLKEAERSPSTSPINSLRFAASKPLVFKPGTQARYSNTNYIALGLVIEKVTGRSYAEELEQRVLDPLGLSRTELPTTRRLADLDDGGYNPNLPWAAGAIVSNAHDLSRFYSALLSGRLLSGASLATMKKTVAGIGLGIFPTELPCGRPGVTRLHRRLPDARQRERGGRPRRRRLAPRAWIPTVARESAALRRASPGGGLCASKVEDRVRQRSWPRRPRRSTS